MKGLWHLRGTDPPLYTAKAADIICDKTTGKQYIRGEMVFFRGKQSIPKTIDNDDNYEFILLKNNKATALGTQETLQAIYYDGLFKK